jgi:hypothetical protein
LKVSCALHRHCRRRSLTSVVAMQSAISEERVRLAFVNPRLPIWLRVPLAAVGLALLWCAADIASRSLFGVSLGVPGHFNPPYWAGFLGTLCFGLFFLSLWYIEARVLYDPARNELLECGRLFRWRCRRLSLSGGTGISCQHRPGFWGSWDICLVMQDGQRRLLFNESVDGDSKALRLSRATGLPMVAV